MGGEKNKMETKVSKFTCEKCGFVSLHERKDLISYVCPKCLHMNDIAEVDWKGEEKYWN